RQMHDRVRAVLGKNSAEDRSIADIRLLKSVARAAGDRFEGLRVSSVCQLVEIDHMDVGLANQMVAERRADETGAAGDEDTPLHLSDRRRKRKPLHLTPPAAEVADRVPSLGMAFP